MPIPTNISPATAKVLTAGVADITIATDVQLAPNGTGYTSNCQPSNPQRNALWYQYTPPAGVQYISFGLTGILNASNYTPAVNIWTQTSPGVYVQHKEQFFVNNYCSTSFNANAGQTNSFLLLVIPGTVYYFQVQNTTTTTIDRDLNVLLTIAPDTTYIAGDLIIPDDTAPYPTAVIRPSTTHLIGYTAYGKNWWGEDFSVIQQGGWVCSRQQTSGGTYGVYCFGPPPNFDLLSTTNTISWGSSFDGFVNDQVSKHYVATSGSGIQYLHRFDAATGVKEITFTIPNLMYMLVGVHTASGIVYYADYNDFSTIHRYNINTNTPMSDFLTDNGQTVNNSFVLPDGTVIIDYLDVGDTWKIYKPDGTLINSFIRNHHRCALDNNLTGIWFWNSLGGQAFAHAKLTSLATDDQGFSTDAPIIVTSGGPTGTNYGGPIFGFSDSCPVLVYPLIAGEIVVPPDLSGIYFVNPTKTHDIYNTDEMKIPNPTVKSALLGE